jgi:hypothetical protein
MKKSSRAGSKPAKAQLRNALRAKGHAPKTLSNRRLPADDTESEVARLKRDLHEALEQQTATSEVLQMLVGKWSDFLAVDRERAGLAMNQRKPKLKRHSRGRPRLRHNGLDAVMAPAQAFGEGWWLSPV